IAALCFVIFFWAHAQSSGITMLAVLLFLLGLVLIGVEIFVMPGVAVLGISGAILVLSSLVLVTLERFPETQGAWAGLARTLLTCTGSIIGAVICAVVVARWLPSIPYFNRIILRPPHEAQADGDLAPPPDLVRPEVASLLGGIGVAVTDLRPAGKVKFG